MKFALPSDDKISLSAHPGRAKGFLVYHSEKGDCELLEYRPCTPESSCGDSGHGRRGHSHENGHGDGRHSQLLSVLEDCDAVVALGMGPRLQQFFSQHQIQVFFTRDRSVERVAKQMSANALHVSEDIQPCTESHRYH